MKIIPLIDEHGDIIMPSAFDNADLTKVNNYPNQLLGMDFADQSSEMTVVSLMAPLLKFEFIFQTQVTEDAEFEVIEPKRIENK